MVDAYQAACEAAVHMVEELDALAVHCTRPAGYSQPSGPPRTLSSGTAKLWCPGSLAAPPFSPLFRELGAIEDIHRGPVEQAVRQMQTTDPVLMLRAKAIDLAGRELLTEARRTHCAHSGSRRASQEQTVGAASAQARLAAQNFPRQGVTPVRAAQRRVPSADVHSRAPIIKR